jgi:hypothetical protein
MKGTRLAPAELEMRPEPALPLDAGCHVIQRQRPQPFSAMSGVAPNPQRPPVAPPRALAAAPRVPRRPISPLPSSLTG